MLVFPNAKINLGLTVTEKRSDGYHNIETVFYPVSWCDALEVLEDVKGDFSLTVTGLKVEGKQEDNLLYKVWKELNKYHTVPPIRVHLHKTIPMGAGLGGGSSDAAFLINALDKKFDLNLNHAQKKLIASSIGSDCAFFLENTPVFAHGRGDIFKPLATDLSKYYILLVYPGIHSNTAEAYSGVAPARKELSPDKIVESMPVKEWKSVLENDFETSIFKKYPLIGELKEQLYKLGALYASMSGSGSSVFGIFEEEPQYTFPNNFSAFLQRPVK